MKSPVCFCHNDLQEGNILLPDFGNTKKKGSQQTYSDDSVVLIDFEYCSYNYRSSDIANHFCEWMYDYSNPEYPHFSSDTSLYPSESQRRLFIREYLKQFKKQRREEPVITEEEVDTIMNEADHFVLGSHLMWTLWGISNAYHSAIVFGYWVSI
jgi:choline/ethanolamine kinase